MTIVRALWTALVLAVLVLAVSTAHAKDFPTTNFYDSAGKKIGSATTYSGGATKYYDERGNLVGTSTGGPSNGGKQRERR